MPSNENNVHYLVCFFPSLSLPFALSLCFHLDRFVIPSCSSITFYPFLTSFPSSVFSLRWPQFCYFFHPGLVPKPPVTMAPHRRAPMARHNPRPLGTIYNSVEVGVDWAADARRKGEQIAMLKQKVLKQEAAILSMTQISE